MDIFSFFPLYYPLCRMSQSVVCKGCHAVMGNHYISFVDIFSCCKVFSEHSWGKKFLLKLFLSSKKLLLLAHKHERQDTGCVKTIAKESAPLLLKQVDTFCQAEPAKTEIPGSSNRTCNHPTGPASHIHHSHPRFYPSIQIETCLSTVSIFNMN